MVDDLTKRRFDRVAASVKHFLEQYEESMRKLNEAASTLEALLGTQLDSIERITGETPESKKARDDLARAFSKFEDVAIMPALDVAREEFDDCAIDVARLAGSLP